MLTVMCLLAALLPCDHVADDWLTTSGRPVDHAVVLARVVSSEEGRISEFRIEVEQVYGGSSDLRGVLFTGTNYERGNAFVLTLHPKLAVGELGIWLVPILAAGGELDVYTMRRMSQVVPFSLPARQVGVEQDENFTRALEWARAVERVESLDAEDRIKQLREYASGENVTVSVWAIHVLAIAHKDVEFLQSLTTSRTRPILAEIALDEAMMRLNPEHWRDSLERQRMFAGWNARAIDSDDNAMAILSRLSSAVQRREIDPSAFFEFVRPIITGELRMVVKGEPHSPNVRAHALGMTRWIINEPATRDDVFRLLIEMLDSDESDRLKHVAAGVMRTISSLDAKQFKHLADLRDHYAHLAEDIDGPHAPVKQIANLLAEAVSSVTVEEP